MSNPNELIWLDNTKWRETGRNVRFGPFDGRLMVFLVLFVMAPNKTFFAFLVLAILFFYVLEYMGYTLPNAGRKMFSVISGPHKASVHFWRRNKFF